MELLSLNDYWKYLNEGETFSKETKQFEDYMFKQFLNRKDKSSRSFPIYFKHDLQLKEDQLKEIHFEVDRCIEMKFFRTENEFQIDNLKKEIKIDKNKKIIMFTFHKR